MDDTNWEQRLHALTHILTSPTISPSLHSQYFIATQVPCYINWDYPPLLCRCQSAVSPPFLQWAFSRFLKRISRFGLPETSWRSKCPYYLPPPLVWAKGVDEGRWGEEERRKYVRERLRRKKLKEQRASNDSISCPEFAAAVTLVLGSGSGRRDPNSRLLATIINSV